MLFFTKLTFLLWNWNRCKTSKKREKIVSKSICFFTSIFKGFWRQLGWILAPKLGVKKRSFFEFFPRRVQEASKRLPRAPRAPQERLQGAPRASKSVPRASESDQNVPRERPRCHQRGTFWCISSFFYVFLRFSTFFCVFLCFFAISAFFCVFMCFFFRSNNAQESPKSCFDMVMLKSRIRQRFLESLLLTRWCRVWKYKDGGHESCFPARLAWLNFNMTLSKDLGQK